MQKIKFNKKVIIFSFLVVMVIVEILVLLPWSIRRVGNFDKKIALIVQKIKSTESDWPKLNQYLKTSQELTEQIADSRSRFISFDESSEALSFISTASKKFEVEISSFSPGEFINYLSELEQDLFYLPISIKAKAKFHNLALFLEYLQGSRYFFDVKKLKVASGYPRNSVEILICAIAEKQ